MVGYILLVVALLADNPVILAVGAAIFLVGFASILKFDVSVRRSCATSGLLHILWIGLIGACLLWNGGLIVRLILLALSPAGLVIIALASRFGDEIRKLRTYFKRAYRQIKRQS